jgi:polysaccharide biosynthesis transport protein
MHHEPDGRAAFELQDYLQVLRRRGWIVVLAVVVVTGISVAGSLDERKLYRSRAQVLVNTENAGADDLVTQTEIMESDSVRELARKQVPRLPAVTATATKDSRIFTIAATASSPRRAADSLRAYFEAYAEYRRQQHSAQAKATAEVTRSNAAQIRAEVDRLNGELDRVRADIEARYPPVDDSQATAARQRDLAIQRDLSAAQERITPRRNALVGELVELENRMRDQETNAQAASNRVELVTAPNVPTSPLPSKRGENALRGAGAGLVLGFVLAFGFEYLDDTIHSKNDLRVAAGDGLPIVGVIPAARRRRLTIRRKGGEPEGLVSATAPRSHVDEAYRRLRATLQFMHLERATTTLTIVSPSPRAGKSTILANLAVATARAGRPVLLVDCDLRRPRIHSYLGVSNDVGLTSVIEGDVPLNEALQEVPGVEGLQVLTSGPPTTRPSELLDTRRFGDFVAKVRPDGRAVLLDAPALLAVSDGALVAARADAVLLVAAAGQTTRDEVRRALEVLRQVGASVVGLVLNRSKPARTDYAYYEYYAPSGKELPATDTAADPTGLLSSNGQPNGQREGVSEPARRRER